MPIQEEKLNIGEEAGKGEVMWETERKIWRWKERMGDTERSRYKNGMG